MKISFLVLFFLLAESVSAQETPSVRDLKAGRFLEDSSFVYALPYSKGKSHLLVQAYQSKLSHKGAYALDFKMKEGTTICAARNGVVIALREDSDKGGLKEEMLSEGNYIIILHEDGSQAHYWHLRKEGALVNIGDTIVQGNPIGISGNTGYSAFPHLHFEVCYNDVPQGPSYTVAL